MSVALVTALLILVQHASGAKAPITTTTITKIPTITSRGPIITSKGPTITSRGPIITTNGPIITTFAGNGTSGFEGDGGPATSALLSGPQGVAVGEDGSVYIADTSNSRLRVVNLAGEITTLTKGFPVTAVAVGPDGSIYASDISGCVVRRISTSGKVSIVAGNGNCSYSGDHGRATAAGLEAPAGVAVGPDGSLYIACASMMNPRVRHVSPSGVITTFAGNGMSGQSGDGGQASKASIDWPNGVAVGPDGSVYIACVGKIRRVLPSGVIVTHAGTGTTGYSGDGGPALSAHLGPLVQGLTVGPDGSVYVADTNNNVVRVVSPASIISTYAGNGVRGYSGDGGLATAAEVTLPTGVALGADGSLYIGGMRIYSNEVRRVSPGSASKKLP